VGITEVKQENIRQGIAVLIESALPRRTQGGRGGKRWKDMEESGNPVGSPLHERACVIKRGNMRNSRNKPCKHWVIFISGVVVRGVTSRNKDGTEATKSFY